MHACMHVCMYVCMYACFFTCIVFRHVYITVKTYLTPERREEKRVWLFPPKRLKPSNLRNRFLATVIIISIAISPE